MKVSFHTFPKFWPYSPPAWLRRYREKYRYRFDMSYALMAGMRRHGLEPFIGRKMEPSDADLAVLWSWKRPKITDTFLASGRHVVVMERGFIHPRVEWTSLAIDGFNARGRFPPPGDDGARWERHFAHHLKPWRNGPGDYALVIGQVPNDQSLWGTDIVAWAQARTDRLRQLGHRVIYRPHPTGPTPCPKGAELSTGTLAEDLTNADRVVTFSSTTAVEAVLAGVPSVVEDEGSVAFPMATHDIEAPLMHPDRTAWCHALAWKQWTVEELSDGTAWAHVRQALAP